jgi:S-adenosylmethionine:tRNA ribosyltransferase-isomerase
MMRQAVPGDSPTVPTGTVPTGTEDLPRVPGHPPAVPEDLDYDLPAEAIAQTPLPERDRARLLVDGAEGVSHRHVSDLPELVGPGDAVVVNDTRVLPARLRMRRATGGAVEVLLLHERDDGDWEALVRPSRRLRPGETVVADPERAGAGAGPGRGGAQVGVEIRDDLGEGRRVVRVHTGERPLLDVLDDIGTVPLPPYIVDGTGDPERYQTVYARRPASAAAPTAGLHFTEELLDRVRDAGAEVVAVELAVGLDTFRPITAERLEDHQIHTERYIVPADTQRALSRARRVVAVGTTVVRCLETWAVTGEASGHSSLFIRRPYEWRVVDALMTNFHLPRSTLLCLLDALIGPRWRTLYAAALEHGYRFLSFGDAMFVSRSEPVGSPGGGP